MHPLGITKLDSTASSHQRAYSLDLDLFYHPFIVWFTQVEIVVSLNKYH
jgi:hypothetical protein